MARSLSYTVGMIRLLHLCWPHLTWQMSTVSMTGSWEMSPINKPVSQITLNLPRISLFSCTRKTMEPIHSVLSTIMCQEKSLSVTIRFYAMFKNSINGLMDGKSMIQTKHVEYKIHIKSKWTNWKKPDLNFMLQSQYLYW